MAVWVTSSPRSTANKMRPAARAKSRPVFRPGAGYAAKSPTNRAPVVGTPTSGAGAPTPGSGVLGRPVDPFYDAAVNAANRNFASAQQYAQYDEGQLGSIFGLGIAPGGGVYDDPSNPFSQAAAMHAAYTNAQRSTNNSMAARGQLYSGARQNAQDENTRQNLENRDRLIREFYAANSAIQRRKLDAQNARTDAIDAADSDSIARALAERPDPESVPANDKFAVKSGFKFVMQSGPHAGKSYNLVPGKGPQKGKLVREYEDGFREAR